MCDVVRLGASSVSGDAPGGRNTPKICLISADVSVWRLARVNGSEINDAKPDCAVRLNAEYTQNLNGEISCTFSVFGISFCFEMINDSC